MAEADGNGDQIPERAVLRQCPNCTKKIHGLAFGLQESFYLEQGGEASHLLSFLLGGMLFQQQGTFLRN